MHQKHKEIVKGIFHPKRFGENQNEKRFAEKSFI
jgi:hypothetical protein